MKYGWNKVVYITAFMMKFLKQKMPGLKKFLTCESKFKTFSTFNFDEEAIQTECLKILFAHGSYYEVPVKMFSITDEDINQQRKQNILILE